MNALLQNKASQLLVVNQAKTVLALLLNVSADTPINIQDTIVVDKGILLEDILKNTTRNADLMVADQQIKIAELSSKEVSALRYPTLRANAGYNYNRNQQTAGQLLLNQNSGPFVGLNLSVPIYNGSVFKRQQQVADINTKNAGLRKEIISRNIQNAAVKTHQAYRANLEQLEAQKKNVDLAQQMLDLALQRFQLRQATIVEIRQAQQSFENAGYTFTNLSFAAKIAEIELLRLVNELK
ncbi:MAG: TolC family protein [Spirosomataceae bacterium]